MDFPQKSAYGIVAKSNWPEKSGKGALGIIEEREHFGEK